MRLLLAACLVLPACSSGEEPVTVFAAASLTEALTAVADLSEQPVELSFAGTPALVAQVRQGAPADVVVTADEASMTALGLAGPVVVARNALAVVVPAGEPVAGLTDLPGLDVVLAGPEVPAGRAARAALAAAGVAVQPVSEEPDVKAVLAKVRLGEADAGVVYATDLRAAEDDVDGVVLPGAVTAYLAAAVDDDGRAFVELLRSPAGQRALAEHGFLPP